MNAGQTDHLAADHVQFGERMGEADRFGETVFGQAAAAVAADIGMQDEGPRAAGGGAMVARLAPGEEREVVIIIFGAVGNQSSPS
jgi:hypothetical protein